MLRLLHVLLSIDFIADASSLSIYSNSGLSTESQVDIVSSKETEPSIDVLGEIAMNLGSITAPLRAGSIPTLLLEAGMALTVTVGSSLRGENVSLEGATTLGFTLKDEGKMFPESALP